MFCGTEKEKNDDMRVWCFNHSDNTSDVLIFTCNFSGVAPVDIDCFSNNQNRNIEPY